MFRIAFYFGRPAFMTGYDNSLGVAGKSCCGSKVQRLARYNLLRLLYIRRNFFQRLLRACSQAGKRDRRTHESQKVASMNLAYPLLGRYGKFGMQPAFEFRRPGPFLQASPILMHCAGWVSVHR